MVIVGSRNNCLIAFPVTSLYPLFVGLSNMPVELNLEIKIQTFDFPRITSIEPEIRSLNLIPFLDMSKQYLILLYYLNIPYV